MPEAVEQHSPAEEQQANTQAVDEQSAPPENAGSAAEDQAGHEGWEDRYKNLQREYTPLKQTLSQKEQEASAWQILATSDDPDLIQQAADYLGVELDQGDEDTPDPDAEEAPLTRAEFDAWQREQQADREAAATADAIRSHVEQIASERGVKLTDRQRNMIFAESVDGQVGPDTTVKAFDAVMGEFDAYAQSAKPKPRVPHVNRGGQSAEQVPDLDDRQGRTDFIRERAKALMEQQS